ncbi:MAG TPA: glycine zipper 2TM domain-containing protein [Burkholderiaceae bacterium]
METSTTIRKIHPLVAGAAISVILVSLVGVAAMTGFLPGAHGQQQGLIDSTGQIQPASTPTGVALQPDNTLAPKAARATGTTQANTGVPQANAGTSQYNAPARTEPAPSPCHECGIVESVQQVEHQAPTSGVGAVAGAVIGGVIGNRFGGGTGRALSTAGGAVGGGFLGNEIEKRGKTTTGYQVTVKMENGKMRTFSYGSQPGWNPGDRVQVVKGTLEARA